MDRRCSRRLLLLRVAIGMSLSVSLLTSAPAFPAEQPTRLPVRGTQTGDNDPAITQQSPSHADRQLAAAVTVPPGAQRLQSQSAILNGAPRTPSEDEEAIRNGLAHASIGMQALTAGDPAKAQKALKTSTAILTKIPDSTSSHGLRLQLIEQTALLKAALAAAVPGQESNGRANGEGGEEAEEAEEEEEDETDTEAAPDLVAPDEASKVTPPEGEVVAMPELDLSNFDVPIVLNEQVEAYILYYQTRKWGVMSRAFERSGRYLPMMRKIFREQGIPQDLVNLAYVESAFNYRAYSRAKASGIWQFIKATGNRYGLKVSYWLDERRDPEKATRAAAAYLKELYEMFQSWPLALAAYNAGEHRIQDAIERQETTDFWSLRLPKETQLFVPAFMAVTIISKDPGRYGFAAPIEEPWEVERVSVPGAVELRAIAQTVGVPPDMLRDLNPALMRGVTPVTSSEYEISLPPGTKEILVANLDQLPRSSVREVARTRGRWHRVRKGETLRSIAATHRTTAAGLAALNGVKVSDGLKVGALLRMPSAKPSSEQAVAVARSTRSRTGTTRTPEAAPPARSTTVHIVKRGETLFGIARAYAVTLDDLRRWNTSSLRGQATLRPGQTLQIVARTGKDQREVRRAAAPVSTAPAVYRVKRGDTLWEIARIHDVTPEELRRWNDLGRQAKLQVGQELMIRLSES